MSLTKLFTSKDGTKFQWLLPIKGTELNENPTILYASWWF
jgi:hypothetical protein